MTRIQEDQKTLKDLSVENQEPAQDGPEENDGSRPNDPMTDIAAEDIFNETVLDELPVGIVVLDRHGFVVKYNRFEEQLARRRRQDVIGRHFFQDVAKCTNVPEVAGQFEEHVATNTLATDLDFTFELPFQPQARDVRLRMRSFEIKGRTFGVIVVEDITLPKELERQRKRLLNIMIHDLRNPLQGILGYTSLLKAVGTGGKLSSEDMAQAIETIDDSAQRMNSLLSGTLAEMRGERREWLSVNMHALVLSTLGNLLPAARGQNVTFLFGGEPFFNPQFPDRAVVVQGVVDQLASLVQNLAANAVKYAESRVRVDLLDGDDAVTLEIEDDGRGISPEDQKRIFDEGFQAAGSLPGAGIGLHSVRRVVELQKGNIEVSSQVGEGSTFRVILPKDAPRAREER